MRNSTLFTLLAAMFVGLSGCDLNDDEPYDGTFSIYFRATIDGTEWAASSGSIGATLNTDLGQPRVRVHADLQNTNEYFRVYFPPITGTDTVLTIPLSMCSMEFHNNLGSYQATQGQLTINQAGTPTQHEYTATFSGTFVKATDTLHITNGAFVAQGVF